jgi:hypothetical protein
MQRDIARRNRIKLELFVLFFLTITFGCNSQTVPKYWGIEPADSATLFAPDSIGLIYEPHSALEILPEENSLIWSVFWRQTRGFHQKIVQSTFQNDLCSSPEVATFSEEYSCGGPQYYADEKTLFYTSMKLIEGEIERISRVWKTQKSENGWSEAILLDAPFNKKNVSSQISVANNGNLYFGRRDTESGPHDLYFAEFVNGKYQPEVRLSGEINTGNLEADPWVDPEERFIIFSSMDREDTIGYIDLYISYRQDDGSWGSGVNLGPLVNSNYGERFASISLDGKILFFTRMEDVEGQDVNRFYWMKTDRIEAID